MRPTPRYTDEEYYAAVRAFMELHHGAKLVYDVKTKELRAATYDFTPFVVEQEWLEDMEEIRRVIKEGKEGV